MATASKRSCYVDSEELPPQATYYLNPNLTRPTVGSQPLAGNTANELDVEDVADDSSNRRFGAWDGVFVSCSLNIFGVIMFLRLGFVVGQAGLWLAIVIVLMSSVVTGLTTLSMSAIATNGEQRAGGAYYMISRTLGPQIGGAIGVLFSIGMSVAISLYVIGFCETLVDQIGVMTDSPINDIRLYGCVVTTILLVMCLIGVGWIIKLQFVLFAVLVLAIISIAIGSFIGPRGKPGLVGVVGWGNGNLIDNFIPKYMDLGDGVTYDFFTMFGIFFPAATGIMAGANLSGELKNPSRDIPLGTISSIAVSTVVYILLGLFAAAVASSDALIRDYFVLIDISVWPPLVLAGIYAATLSSALTSLVGAPRILFSVSRDRLIPALSFFGVTNDAGEPIRAYFLSYAIAIACCIIGHINIVAPLISMFFLGTYAFISCACFFMSISHTPGWRPAFRYYSKYTALAGTILCLVIMVSINPGYAFIALVVAMAIYGYITWKKPDVNWGSAFEARAKYRANQTVLDLHRQRHHVKNFQPSFLVLSGRPTDRSHLVHFAQTLRHSYGSLIFSNILVGDFDSHAKELSERSRYLPSNQLLGFYDQVTAPSVRGGARLLMQVSGLGRLRANTLVVGFKENWYKTVPGSTYVPEDVDAKNDDQEFDVDDEKNEVAGSVFSHRDYVGIIDDALQMDLGFMICRGFENIEWTPQDFGSSSQMQTSEFAAEQSRSIDVWWLLDDGGLSLLVPHCMTLSKFWKERTHRDFPIRLYLVCADDIMDGSESANVEAEIREIARILSQQIVDMNSTTLDPQSDIWRLEIAELMKKFRFNVFGPIAVRSNRGDPREETLERYCALTGTKYELKENEKSSKRKIDGIPRKVLRWLRVSELIGAYSRNQQCVFITAPHPRSFDDEKTYMGVIDMLSHANENATVLIRGTGSNVLTFYSE